MPWPSAGCHGQARRVPWPSAGCHGQAPGAMAKRSAAMLLCGCPHHVQERRGRVPHSRAARVGDGRRVPWPSAAPPCSYVVAHTMSKNIRSRCAPGAMAKQGAPFSRSEGGGRTPGAMVHACRVPHSRAARVGDGRRVPCPSAAPPCSYVVAHTMSKNIRAVSVNM